MPFFHYSKNSRIAFIIFALGAYSVLPIYSSDTEQNTTEAPLFFLGPDALKEKKAPTPERVTPEEDKEELAQEDTLEESLEIREEKTEEDTPALAEKQPQPETQSTEQKTENISSEAWSLGRQFFSKGKYHQALTQLKQAVKELEGQQTQLDCLLLLAASYQQIGQYPNAFKVLKDAKKQLTKQSDLRRQIVTRLQISDLYLAMGELSDSEEIGYEALEKSYELNDARLSAAALNHWGNILLAYGETIEAIYAYDESYVSANDSDATDLAVRALTNMVNTAAGKPEFAPIAAKALSSAVDAVQKIDRPHETASLMLSLGIQSQKLAQIHLDSTMQEELKTLSWQLFNESSQQAESIKAYRLQSYAAGHLAQLYESENRLEEALQLTRQAIFYAQQHKMPEILYRWQWQLGRLLKASGRENSAIVAYKQAIQTLNPIRSELSIGSRHIPDIFRKRIKPVYYELAGLFIEKANEAETQEDAQNYLSEARDTIEIMKSAELEDLFQDECVAALQAKATTLDNIVPGAAVIYPIALADRLVVIASLPDGIQEFTVDIGLAEFETTVRELRRQLQTRPNKLFIYPAKKLYDAMIRPLEQSLADAEIDTIVVVPDGVLTLIPFSTLYDGEEFLVEKFAIVTTPALRLTNPEPLAREDFNALIVGLSDAVQGYSALPNVAKELKIIQGIVGGSVFQNTAYTKDMLSTELGGQPYRIMHMATHGEFDSDPEKTYVLTYHKKLTIDKLEDLIKLSQFREEPVELLTLSACRTAVGDDKAALGLAGVAIKSGARSAIATLWFVDDEATMLTITEFYRQFEGNPELSKAQALRNAQLKLINQDRYWHPSYWAPFLIVGNWL